MQPRPLPSKVSDLLIKLKAPARLESHLMLVHDVACQLTARLGVAWPGLVIDQGAVHLAAAIHDIGKAVHPNELVGPRHDHETAGQDLLILHGWPENLTASL